MSIETGLYSYITADIGVLAIVGEQMIPQEAPEDIDPPFLVYRMADVDSQRDLAGRVISTKYTFEIICCHDTFDDAKELAAAVRVAVGGDAEDAVETTLDGIAVIMYWADAFEIDSKITAQDKLRNQVRLELIILVK